MGFLKRSIRPIDRLLRMRPLSVTIQLAATLLYYRTCSVVINMYKRPTSRLYREMQNFSSDIMDSFIMFNPLGRLNPSRDETGATSYLTMLRNFQIKLRLIKCRASTVRMHYKYFTIYRRWIPKQKRI